MKEYSREKWRGFGEEDEDEDSDVEVRVVGNSTVERKWKQISG